MYGNERSSHKKISVKIFTVVEVSLLVVFLCHLCKDLQHLLLHKQMLLFAPD